MNRIKTTIFFALLLFCSLTLQSQNFQWVNWSPRPGVDSDVENFNAVAVDPFGNAYFAVQFTGIITLGTFSYQSHSVEDVCIVKYDSSGQLLWAKAFGSPYWDQVNGMDCDAQGNLYLTGHYFGVLDYGSDSLIGNAGGREMYLMKMQADGTVAWAVNGANPWDEEGTDVLALPDGGVIMSGRARTTAYIGNLQIDEPDMLVVEFMARFNSDGVGEWVHACGPAGYSSLTYSESNLELGPDTTIYIAYRGGGDIVLNGDTIRPWYYPEFSANFDIVVQRWNANGTPLWGYVGGSLGQDLYGKLAVDPLGRAYVGINSPMDVYFGGDTLNVTPGYWGTTILRLLPDGAEDTAWHYYSSNLSSFQSAASDAQGRVWMGGILRDSLFTDFGTLITTTENHRFGMLIRVDPQTDQIDHFNQITGQGWYSIFDMDYSNTLGSLILGGNSAGGPQAPTSYGMQPDFVIGYHPTTVGNWAYCARYQALPCDTSLLLLVSDTLLCPSQSALLSYPDTVFYPHWSTGMLVQSLQVNTAGEFQLHGIRSNGCIIRASATVNTAEPVQVSGAVTPLTCAGSGDGAIDVSLISGQEPVTYAWNNGQSTEDLQNLPFGIYNVTVTSAQGCSKVQSFQVTQPAAMQAILVESAGNLVVSSVSGGTPPYTYDWTEFPGETGNTVDFQNPGTYTVTITDAQGCSLVKSVIATSVEAATRGLIRIYPNPANQNVYRSNDADEVQFALYASDGRLVHSGTWFAGQSLDVSAFPNGLYRLEISNGQRQPESVRMVLVKP